MAYDSLEILWRGSDPAKFTALQAALRDEGVRFWHAQVHDHVGGFLSSRPYYLEAMPGFEIRVRTSDLEKAHQALNWVESKEEISEAPAADRAVHGQRFDSQTALPYDWDPNQATSEIWSGEDESLAEYIASALRENGIPSRIPDEPGHRLRLCVRPDEVTRARDIVREITEGRTPG
jgi:hypothetical protein